ncbi:hypothetical protein K435DRAFT_873346 [Dendrothele bispora CBS 962.96]|uniref:Uncharacterized protein n=1 Tax=Dendrothele bispora (strain CBS 962.96) TaxID=1314807 RepID=A0A4S8KZT0_DENBC|nr:hypothetical protein K435DRAFT_873346 [Dendrothele bispora CBS 962.96]
MAIQLTIQLCDLMLDWDLLLSRLQLGWRTRDLVDGLAKVVDRRGNGLKGHEFGKAMVEKNYGLGFGWCKINWVTNLAGKGSSRGLRGHARRKLDKSHYTSTTWLG